MSDSLVTTKDKVATLAAAIGLLLALSGAFHYGSSVVNRVNELKVWSEELKAKYDVDKGAIEAKIDSLKTTLASMQNSVDRVQYQMAQADARQQASADRMDKFVSFVNTSLEQHRTTVQTNVDSIRKDMSDIKTQVQVSNEILRRMESHQNGPRNLTAK